MLEEKRSGDVSFLLGKSWWINCAGTVHKTGCFFVDLFIRGDTIKV